MTESVAFRSDQLNFAARAPTNSVLPPPILWANGLRDARNAENFVVTLNWAAMASIDRLGDARRAFKIRWEFRRYIPSSSA